MAFVIPGLDERLIETVILNRSTLCPYLARIYIFYCEYTGDTPLYDLAEENGMYLVPMSNKPQDVLGPNIEEIERIGPKVEDEDGQYCGTFGGRTNPFGWI